MRGGKCRHVKIASADRRGARIVFIRRYVYTCREMLPSIHLGFFNLPTFGLMLWVAAVTAGFLMDRNFRRWKIDGDAIGMVAIAVVAGIVGAKLWHVIDTPSEFREQGWRVLWDTAGFAWFGGLVFGISALILQGWRAKIGPLRTLDLAAPAAAIGYGIGRIGCLLSGDGCYGIPTNLPWGMGFPKGIEPTFVKVHPTPLYEFGRGLADRGMALGPRRQAAPVGQNSRRVPAAQRTARFLVEFIRRNPKVLWGLPMRNWPAPGSVLSPASRSCLWPARRRRSRAEEPALAVEKTA